MDSIKERTTLIHQELLILPGLNGTKLLIFLIALPPLFQQF